MFPLNKFPCCFLACFAIGSLPHSLVATLLCLLPAFCFVWDLHACWGILGFVSTKSKHLVHMCLVLCASYVSGGLTKRSQAPAVVWKARKKHHGQFHHLLETEQHLQRQIPSRPSRSRERCSRRGTGGRKRESQAGKKQARKATGRGGRKERRDQPRGGDGETCR